MEYLDIDAYLKENEVNDGGVDVDAYLAENEQYIDPASAAISSFAQGASGGYLDELAALVEGGKSFLPGDKRSFGQAAEEGAQNKLKQLRAAREQYPYLAPTAEAAGGFTTGFALAPFGAGASTLKQLAMALGLGAVGGAGYAEGGLENRAGGAIGGAAIGGALPTAGAGLNLTGKAIRSGASTISGVPKQWMGRYFERGPEMNKADTLKTIAQEISDDRGAMRTLAGTKSEEARGILRDENVALSEMVAIIKDQLSKADRNNTSSRPVITKLEQYLQELEGSPGSVESIALKGMQNQTVPTSTRTVVGPANNPPVPKQGQGYGMPKQNARGVQGGAYEADPIVVDVQGVRQTQVPTSKQSVITKPREKGVDPTGEYAKAAVTNFDELARWVKEHGLTGNKLAKDARKAIQDALKGKSTNYENKMNEIDALMTLLKESKKGFSTPQSTLGKIRQIGEGRESGAFGADTLDKLGKQSGKDYRSRIDDQMALEAFNPKESLKPTRSKALPRDIWGVTQDVVESAARPVIKGSIDVGRTVDRVISKVPAPIRKMLLEAKRAGGNAVALTHGMLMRTDPEYAAIIEQEQQ